jgi:dephospho-CoA kinase
MKFEKVRILGITGSIATGKSTLTRLIRDNYKDMDIIDCDEISRKLRKKG